MTARSSHPRTIVVLKALEYVGLVLFTIVLPRQMGAERYGSFAGVLAIVGLLIASTGLGAFTTFGRFVPEYIERDDRKAISRLYTQLLVVRVAMSVPLGASVAIAVIVLLPEFDLPFAFLAAGAFMAGAVGMTGYQLQFGLNCLGRSLLRGALGRILLVVGILLLGREVTPELAVFLLFLSEVLLAAVALVWSSEYFDMSVLWSELRDARNALRFGAVFFGANLLLTGIWREGEVVVTALASSRAEVAYYSLASAVAMAGSSLLGQASALMLPSVTRLHLRGEDDRFVDWMATALRYVTFLACFGVVLAFALADWVMPLLLGPGFEAVVPNLKILAIGLVPLGLIRTATSLAVVQKAPRQVVLIGVEGLLVFIVLTLVLVPRWGSLGASTAVCGAFMSAGLRAGFRMGLGEIARRAMLVRSIAPMAVLGLFYVPTLSQGVAGATSIGIFLVAGVALRVVRPEELLEAAHRVGGRGGESVRNRAGTQPQ
jgi:O-antigen/teichoic acid export membrane protein